VAPHIAPPYTHPLLYRYATSADVDEGHRNRMSLPQLEDRMRAWLASDYKAVLFEDDQGITGYALFQEEPDRGYLRQFFIQSSRRWPRE